MENTTQQEFESNIDFSLSQNEMSNIYMKLSSAEKIFFDSAEEFDIVEDCICKCFEKEFLMIETKTLQDNQNILNNNFVKLMKFCNENYKYKKVGIIFVEFCDYFSLDYNKTFLLLHEKLQILIENSTKCMIGKKCYDSYKRKQCSGVQITTLFDLLSKK